MCVTLNSHCSAMCTSSYSVGMDTCRYRREREYHFLARVYVEGTRKIVYLFL